MVTSPWSLVAVFMTGSPGGDLTFDDLACRALRQRVDQPDMVGILVGRGPLLDAVAQLLRGGLHAQLQCHRGGRPALGWLVVAAHRGYRKRLAVALGGLSCLWTPSPFPIGGSRSGGESKRPFPGKAPPARPRPGLAHAPPPTSPPPPAA